MTTITIPKELIRKEEELVLIPRKQYEEFLRVSKKVKYAQLDRNLDGAIAEYKAGKYFGPFNTVKDGIKFLKTQKTSKMKR